MSYLIKSIRLHEAVYQRLELLAQRQGVTVSDLIAALLKAAVQAELHG